MINYIILRLSIDTQIARQLKIEKQVCIQPIKIFGIVDKINIEKEKEECNKVPYCYFKYDSRICLRYGYLRTYYKRRPLNDDEKLKANNLIRAYSAEIFNLMIEEIQKETIKTEENLEVQSVFLQDKYLTMKVIMFKRKLLIMVI